MTSRRIHDPMRMLEAGWEFSEAIDRFVTFLREVHEGRFEWAAKTHESVDWWVDWAKDDAERAYAEPDDVALARIRRAGRRRERRAS